MRSLSAALEFLAHADPGSWPEGLQADCLRALAVAESRQVAAHAKVLAAFAVPGGGLHGDGHRSPRVWLSWQAQATRPAAGARVGWMRRLRAHPLIAAALADGEVSVSWARQICDWSDLLPEAHRGGADQVLLAAAAGGAGLSDLAAVAGELRREHASADEDGEDGFGGRKVRFATTFEGAGRLEGDLTPRCAAAARAVLDALSAVAGPEDTRTLGQRQHDAIEEAFTRLIAADGMLPQRAGQPVRLELGITLQQLAANAGGAACDALIQPVVTGHLDHGLLARLADPDNPQPLRELQHATATAAAAGRSGGALELAIALLSGPARLRRGAAPPAHRHSRQLGQPSAGHRRHARHHPGPPAPGGPHPG